MTITTSLSRITYVTSGGEFSLPIPFKIQRTGDLNVYRTQAGGSVTLLVYGTHYTIGFSDLGAPTGTLSLVVAATAGDSFLLMRVVDILQDLALRTQGAYSPETMEAELDRIVTMILQHEVLLSSLDAPVARALLLDVDAVVGSGAYNALSNRIRNMDDPTLDQDAATKKYVDTAVAGVGGGGGASFVFATVTAAALPSASVSTDGKVYKVRDAGLPDIYKVTMRQSDGVTYEWVTLGSASA